MWSDLRRLLTSEGEVLSANDLESCLNALLGDDARKLDETFLVNAAKFSEEILGFEDFGVGMGQN